MKSDTFHMSMLFDFYGDLLTEKQKEMFDLYYNNDLSLTEISEIVGISRQGVRDSIVRAESALRDAEEKIGLADRYARLDDKLSQIEESAHMIAQINSGRNKNFDIAAHTKRILDIVGELK